MATSSSNGQADTRRDRILNCKVEQQLLDMVAKAARAAGMGRSEWVREALLAGATRELDQTPAPPRHAPAPRRTLGDGRAVLEVPDIACPHPRRDEATRRFWVYCSRCGVLLRRLR